MTPTLLHAVARKVEAITPDADLLARYVRERDHSAFEELVRRHGPLVWAVCRQMLPHHADAEDAFQAVFLALVRSAPTIRDGRTVPAWLHGVAVRVATRARREFARRRTRERTAAVSEHDHTVPDAAWESLAAAVHEEVQRLPEAERTAFVLCDLQGVSQPDAAARLGCPLGSVSGRLCKARQRLLARLSARGIAPAAVVGIGITSGVAGAVPAKLFDAVKVFPAAPTAASTAAAVLARGITEGVTMRVKLMAATTVVVAALGLTGGAVLLSKADAQPPGPGGGGPPGAGGFGPPGAGLPGAPPGAEGAPGAPGGFGGLPGAGGPAGAPPAGTPGGNPWAGWGGAGGPGGMGGRAGGSGMTGFSLAPATWEYKFVDIRSDRKEFEKVITQHGKDGWEFCSSERFMDGNKAEIVLVFKKRKGGDFPFGPGGFGMGMPGMMGPGGFGPGTKTFPLHNIKAAEVADALNKILTGRGIKVVADPKANTITVTGDTATIQQLQSVIEKIIGDGDAKPPAGGTGSKPGSGMGPGIPGMPPGPGGPFGPGGFGPGGPMGGPGPGGGATAAAHLNVFTLKSAKAEEMVTVLQRVFPKADMVADPRTNTVIVRADEKTLEEMKELITRLEALGSSKPR